MGRNDSRGGETVKRRRSRDLVFARALCDPSGARPTPAGGCAMKIVAKQVAPDVYALVFDDVEVALERDDLKRLLLQVTTLLAPGKVVKKSAAETLKDFLRSLKNANDVGIQKFLRVAKQDDILVILKVGEADEGFTRKLYGNMSERSRKMFVEDLTFRYKEGVPEEHVRDSLERLMRTAKELRDEGTLVFENVVERRPSVVAPPGKG
jgi:hypothetical protein